MRQEKFTPSYDCKMAFTRLGERIRLARKARCLTLIQLEAKCGVHRTTLGRLERGDLGVSAQVILAVLEAMQELPEFELILSKPDMLPHARVPPKAVLDPNF